jgi:dsDNA-specific endonuclease/ATPase MutS2
MDTKLTLKLKKNIIDRAKKYANDRDTSLSKLIENYLAAITSAPTEKDEISPLVKSISGVINLPDNFNHKDNYHELLNKKYL